MKHHETPHPLAGKTVRIKSTVTNEELSGQLYRVEDYWDRIAEKSWMFSNGNPACLKYAARSGMAGLPIDDEVLYGKVGPFGHLIHVSEIETDGDEDHPCRGRGD